LSQIFATKSQNLLKKAKLCLKRPNEENTGLPVPMKESEQKIEFCGKQE